MLGIKICGNCRYHTFIEAADDYVCENEESVAFADWTDNEFSCHKILRIKRMKPNIAKTVELYESGMSAKEIAECLGVTDRCVWKRLRKAGIEARKTKKDKLRRSVIMAHEEVDAGADLSEVLEKYGISEATYKNMPKVIRREEQGHLLVGDDKLEAEIQDWQRVPEPIECYPKVVIYGRRYEDVTSYFGR